MFIGSCRVTIEQYTDSITSYEKNGQNASNADDVRVKLVVGVK